MEYRIDCSAIRSKADFHEALAQTLRFPEWYGKNLDALYDCLTDIRGTTHLILENWDSHSPTLRIFRTVLDDAEQDNLDLIVTYIPTIDTNPPL